uniref:Complement system-related protein C3a.1-2 n=1 Tax=Cyprinus carpio TaxID=7962 RepID=A0A5Q2UB31_CYPCA|nr:complement system-related protein C3a.1-2 [Cyprinus carpio]
MGVKLLFLTVVLLSSPLLTLCDPLFVLSAPNLLRVGSSENVFVEAQDYSGAAIEVKIIVKNHPKKDREILSQSNYFSDNPLEKQYVYLQAQFPSVTLEKEVMVSFQSGYIFVQTDKPIYTPASTVQYRIFSLTPNLEPLSQSGITVEIMNPQGITVSSEKIFPVKGMKSGKYPIPEIASPGIWKVVTLFSNTPQKKFTADFEVKEYVLPTFEVKLKPSKSFFYVGDPSLTVDIEAKYLFGQKVDGNAFVVFGVMNGEKKISIPTSLQKVQIIDGEGVAELTRQMIMGNFPDIQQLVGKSLYISASVLTETGSEMVEADKKGIQIVTSPYTIHFKKTPHFFKPGMPFDVSSAGRIHQQNETSVPGLWKLVAWHQNSPQKNFSSEFEVKEYVLPSFEVTLSPQKAFFYVNDDSLSVDIKAKYLFGETVRGHGFVVFGVVTEDKGKISIPGSLQRVQILDGSGTAELKRKHILQTFPNIMQLVRKSLYIAVSVLTESGSEMVEAQKKGIQIVTSPYTIHFKKTPHFFKPGMPFDVSVKTKDPQLSDEQQAVKKMTAQAYKPKGGSNNYLHIGINAAELQIGDQMKVNLNLGRSPRVIDQDFTYMILSKGQIIQADRFKRRGQSLVSLSLPVTKDMLPSFRFVAYYHVGSSEVVSDSVWVDVKDTCMGTLKVEVQDPVNVYEPGEDFSLRITGDPGAKVGLVAVDKGVYVLNNKNRITQTKIWDVVESHDIGCTAGSGKDSMQVFSDAGLLFESSSAGGTDVRTSESEEFVNSDDIVTRSLFPESWLWEELKLPKCSSMNRQCQTTTLPRDGLKLKDSITTWEITAISLSSTHGICVADVHEMTVVKNFFIDLKLPYSAVRNEQIEIKAIIHNLYSRKVKVRVELMETKDICSPASKRGKFNTIVTVDAKSSYSVPFVIVPLALGRHAIVVKAAAAGRGSDGVKKDLLVVSEGVLTKLNENLQFSPSKKGGEHVEVIKSLILRDQAPNTPANTYVSAIGDTISITIEKAISGQAMGSLIILPGGCGEQNMASLTMPVIATHYLDKTNQWHTVKAGLRQTAAMYITRGYNQQLAYRKSDGSYAAYISRPSSTWLTAYVAKIFAMASNIVNIDRNVICSALKWLIMNKQLPDGVFREDAPVISGWMTGNVHGQNSQASMTAFVLIALQEGRGICAGLISSLDSSINKATMYLRSQFHGLTNPYAVAMTSYALANGNALDKQILLRKASGDGSHWPVPGSSSFTLEASAYALLALIKAQDFQNAAPIVNWLNNQRQYNGGYGTTQATIMVFQAVAEYRIQVKDKRQLDLEMTIRVDGSRQPIVWNFNKDNSYLAQTEKIPSNRQITISAKGSGEASVTVVTEYYAKPKESKTTCKNFELALTFERANEVKYQGATESYKLIINTRYLSADRDATMSILDISLLTGFVVDENDLKALSTGHDRMIQKFEMNKQLSERGSLILYLDKISHTRQDRISFRLHRIMNGGFLQPAAVTVYEYYSLENRCVRFYHPTRKEGAFQKICKNDVCQCAEVYKAVVLREREDALTIYYDVRIELALKTGPEINVEGEQRTFALQISCKEALNLKPGESYLIMGQADDVQLEGRIGQYALGERTWLEFWPSLEESKTSTELKEKYNGMLSLQQDLRFG